jgi:hypothetical protein
MHTTDCAGAQSFRQQVSIKLGQMNGLQFMQGQGADVGSNVKPQQFDVALPRLWANLQGRPALLPAVEECRYRCFGLGLCEAESAMPFGRRLCSTAQAGWLMAD